MLHSALLAEERARTSGSALTQIPKVGSRGIIQGSLNNSHVATFPEQEGMAAASHLLAHQFPGYYRASSTERDDRNFD